jgi:universal stress protein E
VGRRVLNASAQLTRISNAELHVLHALQESMAVQMDPDRDALRKELRQKASLELHERLAELDAEVEAAAKFHVGFDSPSHAILSAEKEFEPDLVVFGTISRKGVAGWVLGSTAARMVDRLDCSLLAIKPEVPID